LRFLHRDTQSFFDFDCVEMSYTERFTILIFKGKHLANLAKNFAPLRLNYLHRDTQSFFNFDCVEMSYTERFTYLIFKIT
jgi:hypothetical protein